MLKTVSVSATTTVSVPPSPTGEESVTVNFASAVSADSGSVKSWPFRSMVASSERVRFAMADETPHPSEGTSNPVAW